MSDNRRKLQTLLRELFQFDAADLDFGIYAVLNHKRDEVARFIERDILEAIEQGLAALSEAQRAEAEARYQQARQALEAEAAGEYPILDAEGHLTDVVIAAGGRTMRQLRQAFLDAQRERDEARLSADLEAQVYNDLYRFFARYYDDGDFIPLRRYGADDKYAVPYNGEEVMLYWANADQYYVKSGEYFTDYTFRLAGTLAAEPAQVVFKLTAATVAQNNVKGEKRFFVLAAGAPVAWDDGGRALTVAFEYRPLTDDEKRRTGTQRQQEKLNTETEAAILRSTPEPSVRSRLAAAEEDSERTALARHLARYTARNTRDYFIHKDLGRFLERELDFFLGNEVLKVDDISWSQPGQVRRYALRVQTIREIGRKIIAFLAQIEDFQRRLWEKRKFVVQSDYCATLDRVPPALYPEIAANDRQRGEWARLYGLELGPDADLSQHPFAMVDTAFFDAGFKARLLAAFDDLDAACDGLLVHGENYQALRLLTPRYAGQVKCIYIDPPYNTGGDGFPYKDNFQHSSWLAMMEDRLVLARSVLSSNGVILVSIDDREFDNLRMTMNNAFAEENFVAVFVRKRRMATGMRGEPISPDHEYLVTYASSAPQMKLYGNVRAEADYPFQDSKGKYRSTDLTVGMTKEMRPNQFFPIRNPRTGAEYLPPDSRVWRFQPSTMQSFIGSGNIIWPDDYPDKGLSRPRFKTRFVQKETGGRAIPVSTWIDSKKIEDRSSATGVLALSAGMNQEGTKELRDLLGSQLLEYPKPVSLLRTVAALTTLDDDAMLDFFAGSGTTAHAIMKLNQEDDGNRKYVLVEMADYFDTVLKPRIQKVAYAADWRDGKPAAGSPGQSHMFHYFRLESYEDTLNNLRFRSLDGPLFAALHAMPDYLLHYMLDYETGGSPSLLDVPQFSRPFAYQLNITRHDVTEPRTIDLVATFNFLLGLRVRTIRRFEREGAPVVRVTGEDPAGRRVCVLWRDVPPLEEMEAEKAWLQAEALAGVAYDLLYINGESALPGSDVLAIEPEFKRLMFEGIR